MTKYSAVASGTWLFETQHPAVQLGLFRNDTSIAADLPLASGCYVLLSVTMQKTYVGTAGSLGARVPGSIRSNLASATHVLTIVSTGIPFSDSQRSELEARLITSSPGAVNRRLGGRTRTSDEFLDAVESTVLSVLTMLIARPSSVGAYVPSQAGVARRLVVLERRHPYTVAELMSELRRLGWSATGRTPHRTLRRDLLDPARAGDLHIRISGTWSDPDALVYVSGRRYTSGWQPSGEHPGT